ncbi:hypothetical protein EMCRGX_G002379 [Ephydatia muelleri]
MAKDCQGTLRGACAVCDCRTFVSDKGIRCDYCDHPAAKHQNLTSPSTKPPSSQPDVVVDADGGVEEDSGEDGLPDMPDEALRGATPSTANVFGAGIYDMAVGLIQLNTGLAEYTGILTKFQNDWAKWKGPCPSVDHIFEVYCKNLEKSWKAYKDALATSGHPTIVEQHYHGTTIKCNLIRSKSFCSDKDCGVCGISQQGFMKRFVRKNIRFQRFGQGFYLAPHSSKCHDYTQGTYTHRAMLLCDVLPGKKHIVQTDQTHLVAPPPGYDSVYGQPGGSLNYPEIVMYDEASILPRYVIVYQKEGIAKIAK